MRLATSKQGWKKKFRENDSLKYNKEKPRSNWIFQMKQLRQRLCIEHPLQLSLTQFFSSSLEKQVVDCFFFGSTQHQQHLFGNLFLKADLQSAPGGSECVKCVYICILAKKKITGREKVAVVGKLEVPRLCPFSRAQSDMWVMDSFQAG